MSLAHQHTGHRWNNEQNKTKQRTARQVCAKQEFGRPEPPAVRSTAEFFGARKSRLTWVVRNSFFVPPDDLRSAGKELCKLKLKNAIQSLRQ